MKDTTNSIFEDLFNRYPALKTCRTSTLDTFELLYKTIKKGNKILLCGNGGSAADSEHMVGELIKSFKKKRKIKENIFNNLSVFGEEGILLQNSLEGSIKAISLTSHIALSTAYANDRLPTGVFAQQLYALGDEGDTLVIFSTSGESKNCILAAITAKAMNISSVTFTGQKNSALVLLSDIAIQVPELETYKIQELHLPIYHTICAMLEEEFFI